MLVAGGVGALSETWGDLQRAAGASERLMELLHEKPAIAPPAHPAGAAGAGAGRASAFEHVTFHYPTRPDSAALNDFSLAIAPGEAVALVGPSGAGKSTVFQLLLRFFAAQKGTRPLRRRRYRRARSGGAAPAHRGGGAGSGDLLRHHRRQHRLWPRRRQPTKRCAAPPMPPPPPNSSRNCRNGFDTLVGERGVTLSGGQRQRLAIARAILRDAPLLLLDEATSALDAENELLVQQGLANLMVGRTTMVIAHRLATIQKLKRIVVMDQGRVVARRQPWRIGAPGRALCPAGAICNSAWPGGQ